MDRHLEGRIALVTGGSRGIGLAISRALIQEGARVAIMGRDPDALSRAQSVVQSAAIPSAAMHSGAIQSTWTQSAASAEVEGVRADVRRYEEVERAVAAIVARFRGLDIVINNAGVGRFADVADMSPDDWSEVIETNLTGVFHVCHAALPHLRRTGGGFIINISSLAGKNPFTTGAAYCASKAGLNAFSEALMQEVRYDNIRVSYILPGSVATAFSSGDAARGADWKIAPEDVAEVVINLLRQDPRSLPSRVELRPSKPRK